MSTALAALFATTAGLAASPAFSAAPGCDGKVAGRVAPSQAKCARAAAKPSAAKLRQVTAAPMTTPPLHGADPHGQGTVAVVDITPDPKRPYSSDPTGKADGEDIVVGRARGEQRADGTYHGHITVAALFGNEIVGVDTNPGQKRAGPLDAVQQNLLTPLCNGTGMQICLSAVTADSETTATGSTNRFSTARATLGGAANGADVMAAESTGNISSDGTCQTSTGTSQVTNATVAGTVLAGVSKSSTVSKACNDGTAPQQTNTSSVVGLGGAGVPVPAPGCADGTADTTTGVPALLPIVCNADDSGDGAQATGPYGVRDALDVFLLAVGAVQAAKISTAGSESRAVAPAKAAATKPQCSDGVDNDGDGKIDFPADPGCSSAADNDETDSGSGTTTKPQCSDGKDNDGDGKIDFPADKGCTSASDTSEAGGGSTATKPQCSDGKDNDGDGKVDFPADKGCTSKSDDSEAGSGGGNNNGDGGNKNAGGGGGGGGGAAGTPACRDRVDNDGDGKVDLADPQCKGNPNGTSEGGNGALPFTGIDLGLVLLIGGGTLASGLLLLRVARRRTAAPGPRTVGT